jgi:hypothetical protein
MLPVVKGAVRAHAASRQILAATPAARAPRGRGTPGARLLVARADPFLAKSLLAAGKEPQIVAYAVPIMRDKAGNPP